jgi:hypothetical protein
MTGNLKQKNDLTHTDSCMGYAILAQRASIQARDMERASELPHMKEPEKADETECAVTFGTGNYSRI